MGTTELMMPSSEPEVMAPVWTRCTGRRRTPAPLRCGPDLSSGRTTVRIFTRSLPPSQWTTSSRILDLSTLALPLLDDPTDAGEESVEEMAESGATAIFT